VKREVAAAAAAAGYELLKKSESWAYMLRKTFL